MLASAPSPQATPEPFRWPEASFLFADIVGFAAFTERYGDVHAAELAWRLGDEVERQLPARAAVVKRLGDGVMARFDDPIDAVAGGLRIAARALPAPGAPRVRVGVHCGPAVELQGDFFGATVNLAARVASLANAGEVLVTAPVAAAGRRLGLAFEDRGQRTVRNVAMAVHVHVATGAQVADPARPVTGIGTGCRRRRTLWRPRSPLVGALNAER